MAIITCPDCFEQISHSAPTCIKCGHSFQVVRRGVVGKIMKNLFIWFNISLFLFVLWTFVFAGSIGISGDESSALASGMVATFGILSAMIIWFGGALFWGILVYITKGKLRKPLTPNEKKRDKAIFWGGLALIILIWFAFTSITAKAGEAASNDKALTPNVDQWSMVPLVDEFGDKTGKEDILGVFEGEMSNSISNDIELIVKIQISEEQTYTSFLSYGVSKESLPNEEYVSLRTKDSNGKTQSFKQFVYNDLLVDSKGEFYNYIISSDQPFSILVDLSEANSFHSNKYTWKMNSSELLSLLRSDEAPEQATPIEEKKEESIKQEQIKEPNIPSVDELFNRSKKNYKEKSYQAALDDLLTIKETYPDSKAATQVDKIISRIETKLKN